MLETLAAPTTFSLEAILARLPSARVTVFGDFCLDAYWLLDESETETSIETALPVRRVRQQKYSLGGAGNIVSNLIDLGVRDVKAIGAVGADHFGGELLCQLRKRGADTSGMVLINENWQTMVYAKPYRGEIEDNRIDFGTFNSLPAEASESLIAALDRAVTGSDIVILNQQILAGISTPDVIARINRVISEHPETRFIVDSRERGVLYRGAMFKLNAHEARRIVGEAGQEKEINGAKARVYAQSICRATGQPVFLTRGENGIIVADGEVVHEIPGIQLIERTDAVGAGDTAVAAIAAVIGSIGDCLAAARLANIAASITVRKRQTTGTATPEEILNVGDRPNYIYHPELAEDSRQPEFVTGTEIEVVADWSMPEDVRIRHAIFDHDGTLSTLRQGWEEIMGPMMIRAVLGHHYDSAEASLFRRVQVTVKNFIDKTTGVQTLVQMQGLAQMVRQFSLVAEDEILDEHGYKRIFNAELLGLVGQRLEKLERGELEPTDFQIKNARQLLEELHRREVKLYLVSGTDEGDVRAEAEALGYAHLFAGRVYGAVGDVKIEAKKIVLERIIREHELSGHEFVTFGDGPVEMQETRKRNGICVGVASDEVRRFGFNPDKRPRLIRAGAQLIVPDFSQLSALLSLLRLT